MLMSLFFLISAHATQPTEHRSKIFIIDTGLNIDNNIRKYLCLDGEHLDLTNTGLEDRVLHGTNIAYLIANHIDYKKNCINVIKVSNDRQIPINNAVKALEYVSTKNAKFVNMSYYGLKGNNKEFYLLSLILSKNIHVSIAAGNDGIDLSETCVSYPACYKFKSNYFHVVANVNENFQLVGDSNYNGPVNAYEQGMKQNGGGIILSGTSQATANFTGKLARQVTN